MDKPKNNIIYLTGFMGSGKSTLGPVLAGKLGYTFLDLDKEIERITGKTITGIFSDLGEDYFREIEHYILLELSNHTHRIIALGGGTISYGTNLDILKSTGILIYFKLDPDVIFQRLKSKTDRPLLQTKETDILSEDHLRGHINALLAKREAYYEKADIVISLDDDAIDVNAGKIADAVKSFIKLSDYIRDL